MDAEGELVQAGGFPPLPAQGGGDASPLSPPQLYPEKYLPIVEGVIDGAIKLKDADDEKEDV